MTADRDTLLALADEIEALTGPSLEMDARIAWHVQFDDISFCAAASRGDIPAYTASIDAAYALMTEKLPGWSWEMRHANPRSDPIIFMGPINVDLKTDRVVAQAPTLPLAICAAVVRAVATAQPNR